jgi:cysteine desulfurase
VTGPDPGATGGTGTPVYLDHAAASPVRPEVAAAMAAALGTPGNPSSPHGAGRRARHLLERARRVIADRLGVAPDRVVFTSGGTEANALALAGFPGSKLVGATEHASVLEPAPAGARIPVDGRGVVDLAAFELLLARERPRLVSVMLANNETGVVQPVAELARLARAAGAVVHCDAVQAFGKLPCGPGELGVDLVSVSAHKLGGPPGVGALVLGPGIEPAPLLRGGGQEGRRRAGTHNLPGIVGFAAAVGLATDWAGLGAERDRLERLARARCPELIVAGDAAARLPNISCLVTPGLAGDVQMMALDLAGVAVGVGAACSSGRIGPSHVLAAMGLPEALARAAIRVSLGWSTVPVDIDRFVAVWSGLVERKRAGVNPPLTALA